MRTEKIKIDSEFIKLQDLLKLGGAVDTGGMARSAQCVAKKCVRAMWLFLMI